MSRKRDDITQRRTQVAAMLLARVTQREMADRLGVGLGTIVRDVAAVRAEWREDRLRDANEHITDELARLQAAEGAIWDKVLDGNFGAIDRLLPIMDRRAKLLGLDAAEKTSGDLTIRVVYDDADDQSTPTT